MSVCSLRKVHALSETQRVSSRVSSIRQIPVHASRLIQSVDCQGFFAGGFCSLRNRSYADSSVGSLSSWISLMASGIQLYCKSFPLALVTLQVLYRVLGIITIAHRYQTFISLGVNTPPFEKSKNTSSSSPSFSLTALESSA